ncbi:MAG: hypothetical protein L0Y66_26435 [Myxococcaceae bacterium]|nr:hypothetical protein [Myxococcaceae bacterium]
MQKHPLVTLASLALLFTAASTEARERLVPESRKPREEAPPPHVAFTTDAQLYGSAVGFGLGFLVEGERMGLGGRVDALSLPTGDGTPGRDGITLLSLKPGFSLISVDTARLRLVAGLDAAFAPRAAFLGPGLGLQLEACIAGPLDVEALAEVTPFPFTRVDLQAGLALRFGALALRGGWRSLRLSDQGRVDGNVNTDYMSGPYVGLGLHF